MLVVKKNEQRRASSAYKEIMLRKKDRTALYRTFPSFFYFGFAVSDVFYSDLKKNIKKKEKSLVHFWAAAR